MKRIFLLLTISSLLFVSCNDDDVEVQGPNATIVGFTTSAKSENFTTDVTDAALTVPIGVLSYADEQLPDNDLTLNWEIIANDDDLTDDAVAGTEFDLPASGSSGTVVIPAGSTTAALTFNVHPDVLDPDAPKYLTLKLTSVSGTNDAVVGSQYETIVITLQGVCASALEGEYYITYTSGNQDITIEQVSPGLYRASYFPTFVTVYWWEFSDVCGNLTITDWQFQGANPISGTSSAMPMGTVNEDGSITFTGVNVSGVSWYVDRTWTIYPY